LGRSHTIEGTFSIIARDTAAGELGMAVQSKRTPSAAERFRPKGGLGVIAHQAQSNPMYGQVGLNLLARRDGPQQALDFMLRGDEGRENGKSRYSICRTQCRMDRQESADWKGHRCTPDYCVQGNILAGRKSSTAWWPPLKPRRSATRRASHRRARRRTGRGR